MYVSCFLRCGIAHDESIKNDNADFLLSFLQPTRFPVPFSDKHKQVVFFRLFYFSIFVSIVTYSKNRHDFFIHTYQVLRLFH